MRISMRSLILVLAAASGVAQGPHRGTASLPADRVLEDTPNYSEAVLKHRSPELLLSERETTLAQATSDFRRLLILPGVAKAALEAGVNDKAEQYAIKPLQLADKHQARLTTAEGGRPISDVGDAVFYGHLVLGRLAVLRGDTEAAKKHLLLAGQTGGSPTLDTFGPNMSLARELLKIGERETVLQYLEQCRRFWKDDHGRLDVWSATVNKSGIPDFGANLFY